MYHKVLITGASRGIGEAVAEKFRKCGYQAFTPTRNELDLSNDFSITEFIEKYKRIGFDIIINNAGCNDIHNLEDITNEEMERMLMIDLVAPIKILRGFFDKMKEQKYGRIVNIGSIWGVVSKEGRCVYSAAKNGIHGVTMTAALEGAKYNILVNTVCPGFTLTELTRKNNTEEEIGQIARMIPVGRMARPEEIAEAVYFFAGEANTYITGQKIVVDGGYTAK